MSVSATSMTNILNDSQHSRGAGGASKSRKNTQPKRYTVTLNRPPPTGNTTTGAKRARDPSDSRPGSAHVEKKIRTGGATRVYAGRAAPSPTSQKAARKAAPKTAAADQRRRASPGSGRDSPVLVSAELKPNALAKLRSPPAAESKDEGGRGRLLSSWMSQGANARSPSRELKVASGRVSPAPRERKTRTSGRVSPASRASGTTSPAHPAAPVTVPVPRNVLSRMTEETVKVLKEHALVLRRQRDQKLLEEKGRVGQVIRPIWSPSGEDVEWCWSDHYKTLQAQNKRLSAEHSSKKTAYKKARFKLKKVQASAPTTAQERQAHLTAVVDFQVAHSQLAPLDAELSQLDAQLKRMEEDRKNIARMQKLAEEERRSKWNDFPKFRSPRTHEYMLLNMLGRGGFSEVYEGFDLSAFKRVAIKIHQVQDHWATHVKMGFVRHTKREYEIHSELEHINVARLLDMVLISDSVFATVMELCNGSDLQDLLSREGPLPEKRAKCIITQVFHALGYLHQRRIIHYDLKPGNILFHDGVVKVSDFGLSKRRKQTADAASRMALTSQGAGTPGYLPPECSGPNAHIDHKVDIYSAGVVLYEMLTNRKPFGEGVNMGFVSSTAHRELQFLPGDKVSDDAKSLIARCLSYDPKARPNAVEALTTDPFFKI